MYKRQTLRTVPLESLQLGKSALPRKNRRLTFLKIIPISAVSYDESRYYKIVVKRVKRRFFLGRADFPSRKDPRFTPSRFVSGGVFFNFSTPEELWESFSTPDEYNAKKLVSSGEVW